MDHLETDSNHSQHDATLHLLSVESQHTYPHLLKQELPLTSSILQEGLYRTVPLNNAHWICGFIVETKTQERPRMRKEDWCYVETLKKSIQTGLIYHLTTLDIQTSTRFESKLQLLVWGQVGAFSTVPPPHQISWPCFFIRKQSDVVAIKLSAQ